MERPALGRAVAIGIRSALGEGWLLPVSFAVSLVRSALLLPALAVGGVLVLEGASTAARMRPFSFSAPLEGALAVAGAPRFLALVGGLAAAGLVLAALLEVLWLAGALPVLGGRAAGEPHPRRFAPGVAWGMARQLGTALLAGMGRLTALGWLTAVAVAATRLPSTPLAERHPVLLALASAACLTLGTAGLLASQVLGDLAAARTALRGEGPTRALASALRRALERPGTMLLAGLAAGAAAMAAATAFQPVAGALALLAEEVEPSVLAGPRFALWLLSAFAGAGVELAWLGTVAVLATAGRDDPPFSA